MNRLRLLYFEEVDLRHWALSSKFEASSVELSPNVTAELNEKGELIGVKILDASSFVRDTILETAQAKLRRTAPSETPPWTPEEQESRARGEATYTKADV